MVSISESQINKIIKFLNNDEVTEEAYYFDLGIGLMYEYAPEGVHFSADYIGMGIELWEAFKYELFDLCCDTSSLEPKSWMSELIEGNIRDLIVGITTAITSKYSVSLGIAVPITSMVLKKGIVNYCSKKPVKPKKTLNEILFSKKEEMEQLKKEFAEEILKDEINNK
ncbi:hypothetical protein P4H94_14975 [Paenibacillus macerans]|uniref:Uncharacterized protein n=1 Tax=Paenibacillus macerans TaxID=44252 RepID=A0A090ZD77_PAEMA|nr:hypothetical protein [Paenibacillus macerans]KFN08155.1 hypothetical protein DJ90_1599 [Paenibacillus macerans]MBS5914735.1 hypothetical protein [Paenibacillus macerans]MCY7557731.1 hypothetical protein [Paenibacillus macerans]MEC0138161.1 hypothetical protein [Paenibacillus macerans]MEC0152416.1 hypothetical protein [Paenibacillus macerans]